MSRAEADVDVVGASKKPRVAENEKNENEHVVSMMQMVRVGHDDRSCVRI
jgi:hypothetical protein